MSPKSVINNGIIIELRNVKQKRPHQACVVFFAGFESLICIGFYDKINIFELL